MRTVIFTLVGIFLGGVLVHLVSPVEIGEAKLGTAVIETVESAVSRVPPEIPSFSEIVRQVNPSVVNIYTTRRVEISPMRSPFFDDPFFRRFFGDDFFPERRQPRSYEQQGLGSGVVVTVDGYILTNHHVIDGAEEIRVKFEQGDREFRAEVIGSDQGTDIAVLKVEGENLNLPHLRFFDSDQLEVGDLVLAVGNPFGLGHTVTMGIVSALGRADMGIVDYENFIQTDASINPGNSGGALVNGRGDLVGINTAILSRTGGNLGIGFAVPSNLARSVMESLIRYGEVVRGFLGVTLQEINADLAEALDLEVARGVLVTEVTPDSPAERAGIRHGDVITHFEGRRVDSPRQLRLAVGSTLPESEVGLHLWREGEVLELFVVLANLPESEGPLGRMDDRASGALAGISVRDIDEADQREHNLHPELQGALITEVRPDSAAGRAGLQPGHVILEINRHRVRSASEALEISRGLDENRRILLLVHAGGRNHFIVLQPQGG